MTDKLMRTKLYRHVDVDRASGTKLDSIGQQRKNVFHQPLLVCDHKMTHFDGHGTDNDAGF